MTQAPIDLGIGSSSEAERRRLASTTRDPAIQERIAAGFPSCWEALVLNPRADPDVIDDIAFAILFRRQEHEQLGRSFSSVDTRVLDAVRRQFPGTFGILDKQFRDGYFQGERGDWARVSGPDPADDF